MLILVVDTTSPFWFGTCWLPPADADSRLAVSSLQLEAPGPDLHSRL